MANYTNESIMFQESVTDLMKRLSQETDLRSPPRLYHDLDKIITEYNELPKEIREMIGYSYKAFEKDLFTLKTMYEKHHKKPCWTQLKWCINALLHNQRLEVMVIKAMCHDQSDTGENGFWLSKMKKAIKDKIYR